MNISVWTSAWRPQRRAQKAPWAPPPKPFANNYTIQPPDLSHEVEALWDAARSQATEHRQRGHDHPDPRSGRGVKPGEMISVCARDGRASPG